MRLAAASLRRLAWPRHFSQSAVRVSSGASSIPRVASPSLWHAVIPKAFRQPDDPVSVAERDKAKAKKSKDWNPATFFIVISLLIGSNAIQSIALKHERLNFGRKTDAKIALLRETIERVRRGEDVDVERILGTGDPEREKEWEQVLQDIESEDTLWQAKKRKQAASSQDQPPPPELSKPTSGQSATAADPATRRPGFY